MTVVALIDKKTGVGYINLGSAKFKTSKQHARFGSLILILEPTFAFDEYEAGDIYKVTHVDEGTIDGSVYVHSKSGVESLIFLEEYLVLTPQTLDAAYLMATNNFINLDHFAEDIDECEYFDQDAEYYDELPGACLGCNNREDCYVDIDFDYEEDTEENVADDGIIAATAHECNNCKNCKCGKMA